MGNKKRLIQRGLLELFPKSIQTFYDLFGGSGVVALNAKASRYVLNELDTNIYNLYILLRDTLPSDIIKHIEQAIDDHGLPRKNTNSVSTSPEEREYYKGNYMKFRKQYNDNKNPLDLFVLMNYCLSQTMRFNQKGDFNMPFGNNRFIAEKHGQHYVDFYRKVNEPNFTLTNKSYDEFTIDSYNTEDFVYLDPPYLNTTATYNEAGKWDKRKQSRLFEYCNSLTKHNIRWAMSNVFVNKKVINEDLKAWVEEKGFNVYEFDGFAYHANGKGSANTTEVLITNY